MQIAVDQAQFAQRWVEDPGWRCCAGFITVPNISLSFLEFLKIAPAGYCATEHHTYMTRDGKPAKFDFTVEGINEAVSQLELAAQVLKVVGVDILAQSGTPYSFCHEDGLAFSKQLRDKIENNTGLPLVMMGLAVPFALEKLGCKTVAVASTYYYEGWRQNYTKFLEDSGYKVLGNENFVSLGFFEDQKAVNWHAMRDAGTRKYFQMSLIYRSVRKVAEMYPGADCYIMSGGGSFSMDIIEALEKELQTPVVTTSAAQFYGIFYRMGTFEAIAGRGSLLASLAEVPK